MTHKRYGVTTLVLVLMLSYLTALTQANAQAQGGITFSPPVREFKLQPGQTVSWEIAVTNIGAEARTLNVHIREFEDSDSPGIPKFGQDINPSYLSWIKFPNQISLASQVTEYVQVSMQVPEDARASYTLALLFADIAGTTEDANAILVGETGPLVIINIPQPRPGDADIIDFSNRGSIFRPLLQTEISNHTPYTIRPLGVINNKLIAGLSQQTDLKVRFNNSDHMITSGTDRTYQDEIQMPSWAVGLFEAEVVVAYTPENKVITAQTRFVYVSPYAALLSSIFCGLSTWKLVTYKLKRKYAQV